MRAGSYWNVLPLDAQHQKYTNRRENGRYLTRSFKMRHSNFTSIDEMNGPNIDLNTFIKENWHKTNESQCTI